MDDGSYGDIHSYCETEEGCSCPLEPRVESDLGSNSTSKALASHSPNLGLSLLLQTMMIMDFYMSLQVTKNWEPLLTPPLTVQTRSGPGCQCSGVRSLGLAWCLMSTLAQVPAWSTLSHGLCATPSLPLQPTEALHP